MNIEIDRPALTLERGALARFEDAKGSRILCTFGSLWITIDGDLRDIILCAGDSFDLDTDARVVVMAMSPSSFVVLQPAVALAA